MAASALAAHCSLLLLLLLLLVPLLRLRFSGSGSAVPSVISRKAVARLPGFSGPLPFSLETGYVELDDVRLFYYFIQSERNPEEDPVLLWLTGGPGCSAFSGLVYEIGPLSFDFDGYRGGLPTLLYRPAAWTKVSNIIFLDCPAGTGFSYATTDNFVPSDTMVVRHLHIFLGKWFDEHPQFLLNPLYVAGDSYSGIIVPPLALEIAKGIESSDERLLNLKGYIVGNPLTDATRFDGNARIPFLHGMGIIPDELYEVAQKSCRGEYNSPLNVQCANSVQAIYDCVRDVNDVHVLEPRCEEYESLTIHKSTLRDGRERLLESAVSSICRNATYFLSEVWSNDETVRESLGIHKYGLMRRGDPIGIGILRKLGRLLLGPYSQFIICKDQGTVPSWKRCDFHIPYTRDITSTVEHHLSLITKGYRAMVYNGDHDSKISFVGTQAWIRYLNLSIADNWRPWYVAGQVAGFTRTYSDNLTYATVKGAGHTAPEYMPRECLAMVDRWLSGDPL